jgi:hypothetical protein
VIDDGFPQKLYAAVTLFYGPELQPELGLKPHEKGFSNDFHPAVTLAVSQKNKLLGS